MHDDINSLRQQFNLVGGRMFTRLREYIVGRVAPAARTGYSSAGPRASVLTGLLAVRLLAVPIKHLVANPTKRLIQRLSGGIRSCRLELQSGTPM
jgi:hypothetical protein